MVITTLIFLFLCLSLIAAFIRLVIGPSLPDRVIALDLVVMITIGIISIYTVITGEIVFIDAAVVLALIAFLGTVAYAYFIEKGEQPWRRY